MPARRESSVACYTATILFCAVRGRSGACLGEWSACVCLAEEFCRNLNSVEQRAKQHRQVRQAQTLAGTGHRASSRFTVHCSPLSEPVPVSQAQRRHRPNTHDPRSQAARIPRLALLLDLLTNAATHASSGSALSSATDCLSDCSGPASPAYPQPESSARRRSEC